MLEVKICLLLQVKVLDFASTESRLNTDVTVEQ